MISTLKSRISGSSIDPLYDKYRTFYNKTVDEINIPGVTIVKDKENARKAIDILYKYRNR